jgi:predicted kinase
VYLAQYEDWSTAQHAALTPLIERRRADGCVRECHGDLHLSNLVELDDGIHAFDCIEFNPALRWIDVASDVAFLVMDCAVRNRADLGHVFLNRYLEQSGDYAGAALQPFYVAYRSMVRAKVAALQARRADDDTLRQRFDAHLDFALACMSAARGALVLMCGLSGSGKSWLAERLVPVLPALCIRSDVERKRLAGLAFDARSESAIDAGLYAPGQTDAVYARLADAADAVTGGGEIAIVDATFLDRARRQAVRERASALGVPCVTVYCTAPTGVLEQRVAQRAAAGRDASEATLEVLQAQRRDHAPPTAAEGALVTVDTSLTIDPAAVAQAIRAAAGRD